MVESHPKAASATLAERTLPPKERLAVLLAAFAGLFCDGFELGLMPVASLSVSQSLLGPAYTDTLGGAWFAWFTAALMLGAAIGGIVLGDLGDCLGRARGMAISILCYSVFSGLGSLVRTQEQMLVLRFLVGLGAGGMWPNGVALVAECWPNRSRVLISGVVGAGINAGYLLLALLVWTWPVTPAAWRWLFSWAAVPAIIGIASWFWLPESPKWLASRHARKPVSPPVRELWRGPLRRTTLVGIALGAIPLIGAWAASKWMVPWADKVGGAAQPHYKAITTLCWAMGATLGSFLGAPVAGLLGRRLAYFLISLGATALTCALFSFTAPLRTTFLPVVCVQGFVATLFFGWLPLYLPELFPTRVRAAGSGLAYNSGRFATAVGVLFAGTLFAALGGSYSRVGATTGLIYALGMLAICFAPDTSRKSLEEDL